MLYSSFARKVGLRFVQKYIYNIFSEFHKYNNNNVKWYGNIYLYYIVITCPFYIKLQIT